MRQRPVFLVGGAHPTSYELKYCKTITMTNESPKTNAELLLATVEEYWRDGQVSTVRCDASGALIEVTSVDETGSVIRSECRCGRYNDTMKGL